MPVAGGPAELVSTGTGRTTCAYFAGPDDRYIIYATTAPRGRGLPAAARPRATATSGRSTPQYDIVRLDARPRDLVRLTTTPGYDAEATLSPDGRTILFTSDPRRRPRPLHHGPRRRQRAPADHHARATTAAPSSRPTASRSSTAATIPRTRRSSPAYRDLLAQGPGAAEPDGDLGDGRRRRQPAPGDQPGLRVVRAVLPSVGREDHLLEQLPRRRAAASSTSGW